MASFVKAVKHQARLRMALVGPSGSGKTFTSLRIAAALGEKVAVIDTERGSASKYADQFSFDVMELSSFDPREYVKGIEAAVAAGYDCLVIDSLSHAWVGRGGALELVDAEAARSKSKNTFAAWRNVTPIHNQLVDAILGANLHIIGTMRSKMEYVIEEGDGGRKTPRKVGMAPVQRDGMEYEFDVVGDLDVDNTLVISKTRCSALSGGVYKKPGEEVATLLNHWLSGASFNEDEWRAGEAAKNAVIDRESGASERMGKPVGELRQWVRDRFHCQPWEMTTEQARGYAKHLKELAT